MKMGRFILLIFSGIALATTSFRCNKDYPASPPLYTYKEKLTLSPYKKIYGINDTIWVQFQTTDKTLFDKMSGTRVSTDTTYLQASFYLYQRYPHSTTAGLFSDAGVAPAQDVSFKPLYTYYNDLLFKTDCSNNPYFFRAWFVPKKTGIYSIEPHVDVVGCPGRKNYPYTTFGFSFDLADCNKDIWLSIPGASRGGETGFTDVRIDQKEIFIFKVE